MQVYAAEEELIEAWQWHSPPLRNLDNLILSLLGGRAAGRTLDLGCGSGRLISRLANLGSEVEGIDAEPRAIEIGKRLLIDRRNVSLYCGDAFDDSHPVNSRLYDTVVCSEVLEHIAPWKELLARAGRLLKPGGYLLITVPRDPAQFTELDAYGGHLRRFDGNELLAALHPDYTDFTVRYPGFPCMRAIVWLYTRYIRFRRRSYASQAPQLWQKPRILERLAMRLTALLLSIDNLFSRLPLGTHIVVRARKLGPAPFEAMAHFDAGNHNHTLAATQ